VGERVECATNVEFGVLALVEKVHGYYLTTPLKRLRERRLTHETSHHNQRSQVQILPPLLKNRPLPAETQGRGLLGFEPHSQKLARNPSPRTLARAAPAAFPQVSGPGLAGEIRHLRRVDKGSSLARNGLTPLV
jgi:hypothetical protein